MTRSLTMQPEFEPLLKRNGLNSFVALMEGEVGAVFTEHDDREVRRVTLSSETGSRVFFLKRTFDVGLKQGFWPRFVGKPTLSPPLHEWHALHALATAGVNAPQAAACGEERRGGRPRRGFLLMEAIDYQYTLNDWLTVGFPKPKPLDEFERTTLMYAVGLALGKMWRAGIMWPDAKAKHVYAKQTRLDAPEAAWDVCFLDLERARIYQKALNDPKRVDTLLFAEHRLHKGDPLGDLLAGIAPADIMQHHIDAMLRGVYQTSIDGPLPNIDEFFVSRYRQSLDQHHNRHSAEVTPRLPDHFIHPHTYSISKHTNLSTNDHFLSALRRIGITTLDNALSFRKGQSLNKPGLSNYRERIRIETDEGQPDLYLKRFSRPPLREQLRRMREFKFKRSSGEREIYFARKLLEVGIPTFTPVAWGRRMSGYWEQASAAITAELPGTSLEKLAAHWRDYPGDAPRGADRHDIIRQLALVTARMHRSGYFHRDYYLCHIFLERNAEGRALLSLIDLGRMIRPRYLRRRWIIKDLAALHYSAPTDVISRADRLRFLYHYAKLRGVPYEYWSPRFIRSIEARCGRIRRHDEKRQRRFNK